MTKLWKAIGWGLLIEAAAIAVGLLFYAASLLEGTRWAALLGLAALPILLVRFPEKPRRRSQVTFTVDAKSVAKAVSPHQRRKKDVA